MAVIGKFNEILQDGIVYTSTDIGVVPSAMQMMVAAYMRNYYSIQPYVSHSFQPLINGPADTVTVEILENVGEPEEITVETSPTYETYTFTQETMELNYLYGKGFTTHSWSDLFTPNFADKLNKFLKVSLGSVTNMMEKTIFSLYPEIDEELDATGVSVGEESGSTFVTASDISLAESIINSEFSAIDTTNIYAWLSNYDKHQYRTVTTNVAMYDLPVQNEIIKKSILPMAYNVNVFSSPKVEYTTATSSGDITYKNLVYAKGAIEFINKPLTIRDKPDNCTIETVTDTLTGVSVTMTKYYSPDNKYWKVKFEALWGAKVLYQNAVVINSIKKKAA